MHDGSLFKLSWARKQPRLHDFLNRKEKGRPISKSKTWNKMKKNMTHMKHVSNEILLQKRNKNKRRLWLEDVPKINVEQIKYKRELYLYVYPLGI
jgi:hypothetical protein